MIAVDHLRHVNIESAHTASACCRAGTIGLGHHPRFYPGRHIVRPRDSAFDDLLYAQSNPKACPVLDVSDPGSHATLLAPGPTC
ncbi:DUF1445 domain-containing protein, partial [Rhizobium phaseoli]